MSDDAYDFIRKISIIIIRKYILLGETQEKASCPEFIHQRNYYFSTEWGKCNYTFLFCR